ncbi:MAG: hypothetical protein Q9163_004776 [Psora crenata]
MQTQTGSKINVFQPSGTDIEREIQIIGSRHSIDQAKAAITEKVRAVQENTGRTNGRAPRASPQITRNHTQTPPKQIQHQPGSFEVGEPPGGHEAYVAYGGYQNYVALWYASTQAKQAQQDSSSTSSAPRGSS